MVWRAIQVVDTMRHIAARAFSFAALRVCSFTSIATLPWNGFGPRSSVARRIERSLLSTLAHQPQGADEPTQVPSEIDDQAAVDWQGRERRVL